MRPALGELARWAQEHREPVTGPEGATP
ncbi:hypothetical protein [Catenuloplanes indicus]